MTRLMLLIAALGVLCSPLYLVDADAAPPPARAPRFHPPGYETRSVPRGHVRVSIGTSHYRYYDGMFFEPHWPGRYVVVAPPIGIHVPMLPLGYVSFAIGPRSYFYVNSTFYLWEPRTRDYVVVQEPEGAPAQLAAAQEPSDSVSLFAYPNQGQSEERTTRDRYECHLWAADQAGYDPTYANQPSERRSDYRRAMTACLEGRGYTVR